MSNNGLNTPWAHNSAARALFSFSKSLFSSNWNWLRKVKRGDSRRRTMHRLQNYAPKECWDPCLTLKSVHLAGKKCNKRLHTVAQDASYATMCNAWGPRTPPLFPSTKNTPPCGFYATWLPRWSKKTEIKQRYHPEAKENIPRPISDKTAPMLFVDVKIEEGKSARIVIYEGDTSISLANKFAKDHSNFYWYS